MPAHRRFIVSLLAFGLYTQRLLKPSGGLMPRLLDADRYGWLSQLRYLWYGLAVGAPSALAIGALVGYFYTANYLSWRVVETFYLLLLVVLVIAAEVAYLGWLSYLRPDQLPPVPPGKAPDETVSASDETSKALREQLERSQARVRDLAAARRDEVPDEGETGPAGEELAGRSEAAAASLAASALVLGSVGAIVGLVNANAGREAARPDERGAGVFAAAHR